MQNELLRRAGLVLVLVSYSASVAMGGWVLVQAFGMRETISWAPVMLLIGVVGAVLALLVAGRTSRRTRVVVVAAASLWPWAAVTLFTPHGITWVAMAGLLGGVVLVVQAVRDRGRSLASTRRPQA
ncbi:hypothetical protein [Janibacter alittae]|uniref:SPW repeat-containing protein n=1 Tax=Janibacter alittae TaxID=3115209 RepID=A0ABZ2MLF5_9MICO